MSADHQPAKLADIVANPGDPDGDRDILRAGRLRPLVRVRAFLGGGGDRLARWAHGAALGTAVRNRPFSRPDRRQAAGFGDIVHVDGLWTALGGGAAPGLGHSVPRDPGLRASRIPGWA